MSTTALTAEILRRSARAFAQAAVAELRARDGGLVERALPGTFAAPVADLEVRVLQLAEAIAVDAPELFAEAAAWYAVAFRHRNVPGDYAERTFAALQRTLEKELPPASRAHATAHLEVALRAVRAMPPDPASPFDRSGPMRDLAQRFLLASLEGRGDDALDLVRRARADGASLADLHDGVLVPCQQEVGRMWLLAEAPIADEHFTSQLVGRALDLLGETLPRPPAGAPCVLAFGVAGNLHDLGLRLVAQRLQADGMRVVLLGGDMPASDLAWAVAERHYDLFAVSATMLLHLGQAALVVRERNQQLGGKPPILFGGPPFAMVPDLHRRLSAEAGVGSAEAAVAAARALLGGDQRGRKA